MKNLFKLLLFVSLGVIFLTGCGIMTREGLIIDREKNVKIEVISAMNNEAIDGFLEMDEASSEENTENSEPAVSGEKKVYTDEERWAYVDKNSEDEDDQYEGYEKARFEEGEFKGYKYTRNLGQLDDLVVDGSKEIDFGNSLDSGEIFTKNGNVYSFHMNVNDSGDVEEAKSYKEQGVDMFVEFYFTLPNKATSHNATVVSEDELTYTWDLLQTENVDISFEIDEKVAPATNTQTANTNNEVEASSETNYTLPIIIGAVVVIALIGICVVAKKK